MITYEKDPSLQVQTEFIIKRLGFHWIDTERMVCMRSRGSKTRRIIARCHALSKAMQIALDVKAHYIIEVISERYDKMSREERTKTLIHELMHIPKTMGGGFRHHRPYVNRKNVERMYEKFMSSDRQLITI